MRTARQIVLAAACCAALLAIVTAVLSMRYAASSLEPLRRSPGHATAEIAMQDLMTRSHPGARIEILGSGNDGPGLRYVAARLWPAGASGRAEGNAHEEGSYFLQMEQGWVHLPADEIRGPLVAVGKVLLDHLPGGH